VANLSRTQLIVGAITALVLTCLGGLTVFVQCE
jgi:hypothetical protein